MSGARWLSLYWSRERQEIACDGERFAHPLETNTAASHDVAHLLAAAGGLPWRPLGTRDEVSTAEFNAVLLEHLASNVLNAVLLGSGTVEDALERTLEHARWFLEVHYAPFWCSFDEALAALATRVDVETVTRLSPVFFRVRVFELGHDGVREEKITASFSSAFVAPADGALSVAKGALETSLRRL